MSTDKGMDTRIFKIGDMKISIIIPYLVIPS